MKETKENKLSYREKKRLKKEKNRRDNLTNEVKFIYKITNENSRSCRKRYEQATLNFVNFLKNKTKIHYLKNVKEEHIFEYVNYKKNEGKVSDSTLNLNVTAILFTLKHTQDLKDKSLLKEASYYVKK